MALGQGLGLGDVEACAADLTGLERLDEVVGDDVTAPRDVHEPRVLLHESQLVATDDPFGVRGEGERHDDEVGARQRVVEVLALDDDVRAVHRTHAVAHDGHVRVERRQQRQQHLG